MKGGETMVKALAFIFACYLMFAVYCLMGLVDYVF